jgi:hypothetical protein
MEVLSTHEWNTDMAVEFLLTNPPPKNQRPQSAFVGGKVPPHLGQEMMDSKQHNKINKYQEMI